MVDHPPPPRDEPRWPAFLAILTTGLVYAALPEALSMGPRWLPVVLVGALEIPVFLAHRRRRHQLNHWLGMFVSAVLTLFLLWSLALLILALPQHKEASVPLLRSAACLWVSNILVFALWYWRLDRGGPSGRSSPTPHPRPAFLFPQMTREAGADGHWSPRFIDYLFQAFNTSTALSPTDAPVLARWAKVLMMLQASLSLSILVLLAARAVNIM